MELVKIKEDLPWQGVRKGEIFAVIARHEGQVKLARTTSFGIRTVGHFTVSEDKVEKK